MQFFNVAQKTFIILSNVALVDVPFTLVLAETQYHKNTVPDFEFW